MDITESLPEAIYWFIPGRVLFSALDLAGLLLFAYIIARRLAPLLRAQRDHRSGATGARIGRVLRFWLGQWKQPRYAVAGILHIAIFAGFLLLALRSLTVLSLGIFGTNVGLPGEAGRVYGFIQGYAATLVFIAVIVAAVRRGIVKPERYKVPARYGHDHTGEAVLVLAQIGTLMLSDALFEAARSPESALPAASLAWVLKGALVSTTPWFLSNVQLGAYLIHNVVFLAFLCFLPFGKHFHVLTSLFVVYFAKLERGDIKPVRWGVPDEKLDQLKSFGVKTFEDFTWKHILDFYSCADCGRCADQCPANSVGRPLSPRFLTIKARDYAFRQYPMLSRPSNHKPLIGTIYSEDEVWSCTTCGACEAECPLLVEYIDKIVDLRRGLVDDGNVPQSLQKPLKALESRGNPYGKMEKKRADWTKAKEFQQACAVKVVNGNGADTLYFVDSITSYDDRIQAIGRATSKILTHAGQNFAILGAAEKDSGHEVRRFGEELLFMALRDHNTEAIKATGAKRIVTADPHAFNALRHDYKDLPPVEHISQVIAREVRAGNIKFEANGHEANVYAYHDPCYLGRHNGVYDDPREVLDAIPRLKRVEMKRCRDRSFCCGGGGLALFYEPHENERMGVKRVRMAAEAGANVIVTACPFCMVNIEDAIKVAGMESTMTAIDLTELVESRIARTATQVQGEYACKS